MKIMDLSFVYQREVGVLHRMVKAKEHTTANIFRDIKRRES
jgi:hypothetical protein